MSVRIWTERGFVAGNQFVFFNTAQARWVTVRGISVSTAGGRLTIFGVHDKPFNYVNTLKTLDANINGPLFYWPLNDVIYDGPQQLTAANYATATRLATDIFSAHTAISNTVLTKTNHPFAGKRWGSTYYLLNTGQSLITQGTNTFHFRNCLKFGTPCAVEMLFNLSGGLNNWLFLDANVGTTEYAGLWINGSGQLVLLDSVGTVSPVLATPGAGLHHLLVHYTGGGAQFLTYLDGALVSTTARATIAYPTANSGAFGWNQNGAFLVAQPAFYFNPPAQDFAGMAQRHNADLVLNYFLSDTLADSGIVTWQQQWDATITRDDPHGLPDVITLLTTGTGDIWRYEVQIASDD